MSNRGMIDLFYDIPIKNLIIEANFTSVLVVNRCGIYYKDKCVPLLICFASQILPNTIFLN